MLLLAVGIAYAVSKLRRKTAEKQRSAAHAADNRVVHVAQAGAAVVELVPTGVVKTSVLVTRLDSEGNAIVQEREVSADQAAGEAQLPQGTILRKTQF